MTWALYGRADLAVDRYETGSYAAWDLASNASRMGARAQHTLDTGMVLEAQLERAIELNRGTAEWRARDTFLGLTDEWGQLRLGYVSTVLRDLRRRVDVFGSQMGNARNVLRSGHDPHFDDRFPRSLRFSSPQQPGLGLDLQVGLEGPSADEAEGDGVTPRDRNDRAAWGGALRYRGAAFWVAAGYEQRNGVDEAGGDSSSRGSQAEAYRLAFAWEPSGSVRVTALGQVVEEAYEIEEPDLGYVDALAYGAGLRYALDDELDIRLQYYTQDADEPGYGANLLVLGPVFHASDRVRLYATATYLTNKDRTRLVPWHAGRTAGPPAGEEEDGALEVGAGRSAWGLSSGIRYAF